MTASLVFGGAVLWLSLSIPVGILSALRPRSIMDRVTMTLVLIGISAHPVWIGLIFSYVFGYKLGLTPIAGYCNFFPGTVGAQCEGPVQLGLPPDPALVHVHDPVRRALRAPDPSERDGDDERGLRAHCARQGRLAAAGHGAARAAQQHASGRDDPRAWISGSRSAARSSPRASSTCPASAARSSRPTTAPTCR